MKKIPTYWNNEWFESRTAAAEAANLVKANLSTYIKRGYKGNADFKPRGKARSRPVVWNDIPYPSMADAAAAQVPPISREAMRQRIEKGYNSDEELKWKKRQ
jgi:hypothetical protein